jgi:hypothetical protein
MTDRRTLKAEYAREDDKLRLSPNAARYPGTYFGIAERAKKALQTTPTGYVEINCFNDVEAELIADQLTKEERARVHFKYLFTISSEECK